MSIIILFLSKKILCALKDYFLFILQGRISYPKNPPALVSRFLNELPVNGGDTLPETKLATKKKAFCRNFGEIFHLPTIGIFRWFFRLVSFREGYFFSMDDSGVRNRW